MGQKAVLGLGVGYEFLPGNFSNKFQGPCFASDETMNLICNHITDSTHIHTNIKAELTAFLAHDVMKRDEVTGNEAGRYGVGDRVQCNKQGREPFAKKI